MGGTQQAADDVAELEWIPINDAHIEYGFQNAKDGLRDLKKLYNEGKL